MFGEDFFRLIVLIGSIQGFILSTLLFLFKTKRLANQLLGLLVLLIALAGFGLYADSVNWFGISILQVTAQIFPFIIVMPTGPLLYFYVQAYIDPTFKISKKNKVQFLPAVLDLVPKLVAIYFITGVLLGVLRNNPAPYVLFMDTYNVFIDIVRWGSLTLYLLLSYRYIRLFRLSSLAVSKENAISYRWLSRMIKAFFVFQVIWLIYLVPYILFKGNGWLLSNFGWYPIYVPMAILVYYLGMNGYMMGQREMVQERKEASLYNGMPEAMVTEIHTALENAMERDRLYLNPDLNLNGLAQLVAINPKVISAVLNGYSQVGFNEFVNRYRIKAFKEMLLQPGSEKFTITGIAFDCGFNSQATFQRTFKQLTGMSPSEYKRSLTVS